MSILEDGQIFERYRITRWLGSSSTGESYEAEDRMLLRKVTLKLIHPWTTLPDSARRQFFREMQGISTLNHPYLAAVLDYGEIDGRIYVARRYVSSGSLLGTNGRLWYRAPLAVADAFTYAHQLAQVLQYVHQHGYLHGSLTFTNVLVLRGPNVEQETEHAPFLVADIGLTNFVRRFGHPQVETLPVSAAPEQLGKRVTPASDQFALAVLLYFWLTGRPPYLGTPDEVEKLKLTGTITPLSALNPGLTPEQDSIILRALAVYPEERHASVLAFAEALKDSQTSLTHAPTSPFSAFPIQPETPRAHLHLAINETSVEKAAEAQAKLHTEPDEPRNGTPIEEVRNIPVQKLAILPTLPETPRLEEGAVQLDFASSTHEEAEPPSSEMPVSQPEVEPAVEQLALPDEAETDGAIGEEQSVSKRTAPLNELVSDGEERQIASTQPGSLDQAGNETLEAQTSDGDLTPLDAQLATIDVTSHMPRLIVFSPYISNPYEFVLNREEINVGRAGASDLKLEQDNLTSRHHALLKREGERVLIFDKRSYNGVFINGQQIEVGHGYELADGDHISIGNYELIFRSALGSSVPQTI